MRQRLQIFAQVTQTPAYDEFRMVVTCAGILLFLVTALMVRTFSFHPDKVLAGIDIHHAFLGWYEFVRQSLAEGHLPLWDPYQNNGYPFLHNPQVAFFYPPTWLAILLPGTIGITLSVVLHLWLSGLGMLLFVRFMGSNWPGAILSAIAFALGHHFAIRVFAGHLSVIATNTWFPWLLLGTAWSVRRATLRATLLPGLIWALSFLAGHTSSLLYIGLGWFVFLLYLMWTTRQWFLITRQAVLAIGVSLGLSAAQWLPTLQFILLSTRTFQPTLAFATSYSFVLERLTTLFSPDFLGNPVSRIGFYGPGHYWEMTYYAGMLPIIALMLSWRRPTHLIVFYWALLGLAILLGVGENGFLYQVFYNWLPPFRLGRIPARFMFLAVFALSALLGTAISEWDRIPYEQRLLRIRQQIPASFTVSIVLIIGSFIFAAFVTGQKAGGISDDWMKHYVFYGVITVLLFSTGLGLILSYLQTNPKQLRRRYNTAFMLILFVALESFAFGFRFLNRDPVVRDRIWLEAKGIIGETLQRVLAWDADDYVIENDATRVKLTSITAYNPLELGSYEQLLNLADSPDSRIYDLLGVSYLITFDPTLNQKSFHLLSQSQGGYVYERPSGLPWARLVPEIEVFRDDEVALVRLQHADFDAKRTVIVDEQPDCSSTTNTIDFVGSVHVVANSPGYWLMETQSNAPSVLVVSETAFPGWQVTIDGRSVAWYTAYTVIRAVCVPAGTHQIEWVFDPWVVKVGIGISVATLFMVVGVLALKKFGKGGAAHS